jgi:hypothetical protein
MARGECGFRTTDNAARRHCQIRSCVSFFYKKQKKTRSTASFIGAF